MTLEDQTEDFDVVATNPAAYYEGPAEVLADAELTREQKLRILEEWEIDLKRTLESDSEGMAQGPDVQDEAHERSDDAALLRNVSNYLRRARGEDADDKQDYVDAPSTMIGRIWRRITKGSGGKKQMAA